MAKQANHHPLSWSLVKRGSQEGGQSSGLTRLNMLMDERVTRLLLIIQGRRFSVNMLNLRSASITYLKLFSELLSPRFYIVQELFSHSNGPARAWPKVHTQSLSGAARAKLGCVIFVVNRFWTRQAHTQLSLKNVILLSESIFLKLSPHCLKVEAINIVLRAMLGILPKSFALGLDFMLRLGLKILHLELCRNLFDRCLFMFSIEVM